MRCVTKVHRGKICIFREDRLLAKFEKIDVDPFHINQWKEILDGVIGHVPERVGPVLEWSSGTRERKKLAKKKKFSVYDWDSRKDNDFADDIEDDFELDDEE